MFESSTTQPTKFIWPAARALAAEKTWLLQCLKAQLRNLRSLSGQEGGLFQPKSVTVISYYSSFHYYYVPSLQKTHDPAHALVATSLHWRGPALRGEGKREEFLKGEGDFSSGDSLTWLR